MDESSSATPFSVGRVSSPARATPVFLGLLFIALLGFQLLLYRDSFAVKPSNDDFIALHQIDRGEKEGVGSFFMASDTGDYRPLQNATLWLFGRFSRQHAFLSLRILHFLSVIVYAGVAFLWMRTLRFTRIAAVAAACVVFLHPTLAGSLAGLDNYSRLVVSAWVWLGAWIAYVYGGRFLFAAPLVSLCFAIGLGYMEYAIALVPLAVLAAAWGGGLRRFQGAGVVFLSLMATFIVYFAIRVSGMVVTTSGTGFLSLDPLLWRRNTALILGAALFFGNTVPIMLGGSLAKLVWLGSNVTLVAVGLGYGLWAGRRRLLLGAGGNSQSISRAATAGSSPLGFTSAAFAVTFFPVFLMKHISEIYLTAVTLGLALLIGLSAHGWTMTSRPLRNIALFLSVFQLMIAAHAIQQKVAGIKEGGERADAMMQQLLKMIPNDASTKKIGMVFVGPVAVGARGYSVFAIPDDELILRGYGTFAIRWYRRDLDVRLDHLLVKDPSSVDRGSYDLLLLWDAASRQFRPLATSASRL